MKTIKNLSVLFMALMFAVAVSAQGTATTGLKPPQAQKPLRP